jgi:hypothetical protein
MPEEMNFKMFAVLQTNAMKLLLERLVNLPAAAESSALLGSDSFEKLFSEFQTHYQRQQHCGSEQLRQAEQKVMEKFRELAHTGEQYYQLNSLMDHPSSSFENLQKAAEKGHWMAMRKLAGHILSGEFKQPEQSIPWALQCIRYLEKVALPTIKLKIREKIRAGQPCELEEETLENLMEGIERSRRRIASLAFGESIPDPNGTEAEKERFRFIKEKTIQQNTRKMQNFRDFLITNDIFQNLYQSAPAEIDLNEDISKPTEYRLFVENLTASRNPNKLAATMNAFYATQAIKTSQIPVESLADLLEGNFVVGEAHSDLCPKDFLIKNMKRLKETGFTMLFIEHLNYEEQDRLETLSAEGAEIGGQENRGVSRELEKLDRGFRLNEQKRSANWQCTYTDLVQAAHANGIRVVGLDTKYTYQEQYKEQHMEHYGNTPTGMTKDNYRIKTFNYTATKIIEKECEAHPGKWCALIGNVHCRKYSNVPGVAELTGAMTVLVSDAEKETQATSVQFTGTYSVNQKTFLGELQEATIPFDVQLQYSLTQETPVLELPPSSLPRFVS